MMKRNVILFGGTFDPIHNGHTHVAEAAAEKIGAAKVVFIPAKRSPHKQVFPVAGAEQRIEMISLAIEDRDTFCVSDVEVKRPEPSYTLDTMRTFKAKYGEDTQLYWLIGADMVGDLAKWHRINELIDQCNLSVMLRGGFKRPDFGGFEEVFGHRRVEKLRQNVLLTPAIDISSTQIRRRVAAGLDFSDMVHSLVAAYIEQKGLYRGG
jgi:nicotinate-nucleotide adenylyltransferase